jgi:hypothetical protein
MTDDEFKDELAVREIVENWALYRDARKGDRFREIWHKDGRMITTWIQAGFEDFIKASRMDTTKVCASCTFLGG